MLGCCGANLMMTPEHPLQLCGTSLGPERAVPCAVLLCLLGCQVARAGRSGGLGDRHTTKTSSELLMLLCLLLFLWWHHADPFKLALTVKLFLSFL